MSEDGVLLNSYLFVAQQDNHFTGKGKVQVTSFNLLLLAKIHFLL